MRGTGICWAEASSAVEGGRGPSGGKARESRTLRDERDRAFVPFGLFLFGLYGALEVECPVHMRLGWHRDMTNSRIDRFIGLRGGQPDYAQGCE